MSKTPATAGVLLANVESRVNGVNYVNEVLADGLNNVSANDIMLSKLFL